MVVECRLYVGFEFSRLDDARSGSALTCQRARHSLPSPFESLFAKRKRTPMVSFSFWPALGDSNPQPSESESDTLSNCAKGRYEIPCGIYLFSESFIRFSAFL